MELQECFRMILRIIAGILLGIWLVLVVAGKGGFVHMLLLNGIGVTVVELMTVFRTRMKVKEMSNF
jgi:hypothetical protein